MIADVASVVEVVEVVLTVGVAEVVAEVGVVAVVEVVGIVFVVVGVEVGVEVVELVDSTELEVELVPTVNFAEFGAVILLILFTTLLVSTIFVTAFFTAAFAGVFTTGLVATFTVVFGASRLISAADATEGVTIAIAAIVAARVTFFMNSFQNRELLDLLGNRRLGELFCYKNFLDLTRHAHDFVN